MPTISPGDQTIVNSYPQGVDKYLSICPRTVLYSGQLNGDPTLDTISGGVISFTADNTSGLASDCIAGMTIDFGTLAGGHDIGHARLRDTTNGITIEINEISFADLPIVDNVYFSIREEFRPWQKMLRLDPRTTGNSRFPNNFTEYHDYDEGYVNQNVQIAPCVNITRSDTDRFAPKYAGFLDDGESYRTVTLSSAFTEFLISGETKVSTLWDVGDGTNLGLDTDETITVQFPEGHRYISCTEVGSGGGSKTVYIPIHAHGDTYMPFSSDLRGFDIPDDDTNATGRKMKLRIFGQENSALEDDTPIGSPYVYWENNATFDGTAAPDQYRDTFYGWSLNRKSSTQLEDPVEVELAGVGYWLNILQGFGLQIEDVGRTPNKHFYMENMTADKVLHYILREFTTATELFNIFLSGIDTDTVIENIKKASVYSQIDSFMQSFKANVRCDTSGAVWIRKNINYMDAGEEYDTGLFFADERAGVDNIITIDDSMVLENGISVASPAIKPMGRVDAAGAYSIGVKKQPKVIASRAPGKVQGQSSSSDSTPFIRLAGPEADAIFELNYASGRLFAKRIDTMQGLEIQLAGNLDVFELAWGETIKLDISSANAGGLSISPTDLFTIESIKIAHSNEFGKPSKAITLTVSRVTNGLPGVNIPIEEIDWLDNPFYDLFFAASSVIPPPNTSTPTMESFNDEIISTLR